MPTSQSVTFTARGSSFDQGKSYIARISGTDPKFGLARDFLASKRDSSKSGRTWTNTATVTAPGLYEVSDTGKRGAVRSYYIVLDIPDRGLHPLLAQQATAFELAKDLSQIDRLGTRETNEGKLSFRDESGDLLLEDRAVIRKPAPQKLETRTESEKPARRPDLEPVPRNSTLVELSHRFAAHAVEKSPDLRRRAKRVVPIVPKTGQDRRRLSEWQANPSKLDVEGVDTPGSAMLAEATKIRTDAAKRHQEMKGSPRKLSSRKRKL